MFRHVVMFDWNDDVDEAHIALVGAGLDRLAREIPEVRAYRHGPDHGLTPDNFDYVVVGDFATVDDYIVYRDHPTHQTFISELIVGRLSRRAAVQFELADGTPG